MILNRSNVLSILVHKHIVIAVLRVWMRKFYTTRKGSVLFEMKDRYKVWLILGAILVIIGLLSEVLIVLGVIILIVVLILHLRGERSKSKGEKMKTKKRGK